MHKKTIFKGKESEKDFIELKDRKLKKQRVVKMKRGIEELFFKPAVVPVDDISLMKRNEEKKIN